MMFMLMISYKQIYKMDNQFINSPLLVRDRQLVDPRDQLIKGLEIKNYKLKSQLIKIKRSMQQKFEEMQQEGGPKKRQSIFQDSQNLEVLNNQLANTYKRIKMYEYQISKLEENNRTVNISQKTSQLQLVVKEKKTLSEKLRQQYLKEQRMMQQNTKRLENSNQKDELEQYMKKITQEANFFRQKVKVLEQKQKIKTANFKKQYAAIKQLQKQMLQMGVAQGEIQQIKNRSIKGNKKSIYEETKQAKVEGSDQEIQDKTREHYDMLMADISILEKMRNDHEKQLSQAEEEKQEAIRKNMTSRNKLLQCENEIQNLQKEILIMKTRVVPSNLKPLKPIRSYSSYQPNPNKILPSRSTKINNKNMSHLLKHDQVGLFTAKGQRFTDRHLIGKNNLLSKIVAVKVYFDKSTGNLAGIQCTYQGNKQGADNIKRDKDARENYYDEEKISCKPNAFIRSISGTVTANDRVQSLMFTTSDGTNHRFGTAKTTQKQFTLDIGNDQFPVCVYGSLLVAKEAGKRATCQLQFLGFQIQNQQAIYKSVHQNEFNN